MSSAKPKWDVAKLVIESVITSIGSKAHLALVLPPGNTPASLDFSDASDALLQRIRRLGDNGDSTLAHQPRTTLADSLSQIVSLFGTPVPGDAMYVVSEGDHELPPASTDRVERAMLERGVRFYALYLSVFHDHYLQRNETNPTPRMFTLLADETGGKLVDLHWLPSSKPNPQLEASLRSVYSQMTQFYSLVVSAVAATDDNQTRGFAVVDSRGEERKDLKVMYPRKLSICGRAAKESAGK